MPPEGFWADVRAACDEHAVLMIADEIQSGLARTGELFALDHEGVRADLYTLGKALGGGIVPVSAVVGRRDVLGVLKPGQHGSTFGGNPLACAVGRAVVELLRRVSSRSAPPSSATTCTSDCTSSSTSASPRSAAAVCGPASTSIRPSRLAAKSRWPCATKECSGKETHEHTLRIAPPLVITREEIDHAIDALADALKA